MGPKWSNAMCNNITTCIHLSKQLITIEQGVPGLCHPYFHLFLEIGGLKKQNLTWNLTKLAHRQNSRTVRTPKGPSPKGPDGNSSR